MLHELIHNITGKDGNNTSMYELDVQIISNLLGNPRDPKGINSNTWVEIKKQDDFIRDYAEGLNSDYPPPENRNENLQDSPWLNGNYFSWNPQTHKVRCGKGKTLKTESGNDFEIKGYS